MTFAPIIQYATLSQVEIVVDLFRRVVEPLAIYSQEARAGEIQKFSPERLRQLIEGDTRSISIAYLGERPVGFSITDDQHGPIWIDWYGVISEARGKGVGEALINQLLREGPSRGATKLWCDTRDNNGPSIALFKKMGFRQLCELNRHWYGQDFFLWGNGCFDSLV